MAFANFFLLRNRLNELPWLIGWALLNFASPLLAEEPVIRVSLSISAPSLSYAVIRSPEGLFHQYPVGSGEKGFKPEGARFENGLSLLGRFRVSAVLSMNRFEMEAKLIEQSGHGSAFLRTNLFANMSRIDFDGDGAGNEYGAGFVGLRPESDTAQPFEFGDYRGIFRWYSYAIHGTDDETRVGRRSTGGCINLKAEHLRVLLECVRLGDLVEIRSVP